MIDLDDFLSNCKATAYAGIGSRTTPLGVIMFMTRIAITWIASSGCYDLEAQTARIRHSRTESNRLGNRSFCRGLDSISARITSFRNRLPRLTISPQSIIRHGNTNIVVRVRCMRETCTRYSARIVMIHLDSSFAGRRMVR